MKEYERTRKSKRIGENSKEFIRIWIKSRKIREKTQKSKSLKESAGIRKNTEEYQKT